MPRKTIAIYDGDDYEVLAEKHLAVKIAERNLTAKRLGQVAGNARWGDDDVDESKQAQAEVDAAKDEYDAFEEAAAARAEKWVLQSIGHKAWRDLVEAHPARKVTEGEGDEAHEVDHPDDADFGVDTTTFPEALLLFVDPKDGNHRTVKQAGDVDLGQLAARVDRLSQGETDTLWMTAYHLNTGGVADPKASRYSIAPKSSES